jgi:hypothetical protein
LGVRKAKYGRSQILKKFPSRLFKRGGFLVSFHNAIAVFIGGEEFECERKEILRRLAELKFSEEEVIGQEGDSLLVGLYARGKLQKDAHHFKFYKRICGDCTK